MPRQLKQFFRNRKKEMLACWDCECRTLHCRREANCICDEWDTPPAPIPVESLSDLSTENVYVSVGQTTTVTLNYTPIDANDFSELDFDFDSYSSIANVSVQSYSDGVLTLAIEWTANWNDTCEIFIGSTSTGLSIWVYVQPMHTITITPDHPERGAVSENSIIVPEWATYTWNNTETLTINGRNSDVITTVTVSLVDEYSAFEEWSVNGSALEYDTPYTVSGDVEITAVFEEPCYP